MRRRQFITLLGTAVIWPLTARAQQTAMPVVGFLNAASSESYVDRLRAFREGLGEAGFVEGRNVVIEYRWADGHYDRLPTMVADLVRRQVAVIAATGGAPSALAAKAVTKTIPIVFAIAVDPIEIGLVNSLSRPEGNVTGLTNLGASLTPKQLELLQQVVGPETPMALLVNPDNPNAESQTKQIQAAAIKLRRDVRILQARTESDFDAVFTHLARQRIGALVIAPDPFFISHKDQLAALTVRHAVPAIYTVREFAAAGGLMSYGDSLTESYRLAGVYTGRVLRGDRPSDLPVQQATKVMLTINLKTAKRLGLVIPEALLARADEVIE